MEILEFQCFWEKGLWSCSSPGGRGGGGEEGGGRNICVRLHSRSIFMMPLRVLESVSLSSVTVGHCVGWNISPTVKHCCFPLGVLCCACWWTGATTLGVGLGRCTMYKLSGNFPSGLVLLCLVSEQAIVYRYRVKLTHTSMHLSSLTLCTQLIHSQALQQH